MVGNIEQLTSLQYKIPKTWSALKSWWFPRQCGNVFHVNESSCVSWARMRIETSGSTLWSISNLNDHKAGVCALLTFPRCASQPREEGVDEVGAATRWENSVEEKERAEQWEMENRGSEEGERGCHRLQGWGRGARGKRDGGLGCLGGGTTGNDRIIRTSIWQEINTVWAGSPRGRQPDIVENYNKLCRIIIWVKKTFHSELHRENSWPLLHRLKVNHLFLPEGFI